MGGDRARGKVSAQRQRAGLGALGRILRHGSGRGPGVAVEGREREKQELRGWRGLCEERKCLWSFG
jgi:hypothetical protein